ncbi:MAG: DUF6659 family protein [Nitrosotalea sp.]
MMLTQSDTLESICDEILNLDSKMMFVGIINDKGRLLVENKKEGIEVFGDSKDQEMLLMEIALGVRMRREHDSYLGQAKFTISLGDKVISMIFPLCKNILYIFAEKEIDALKASLLISQLLEKKIKLEGWFLNYGPDSLDSVDPDSVDWVVVFVVVLDS